MAIDSDWYPKTQADEYEMYQAIFANIDEVNKTLNMDASKAARLKEMAQVFIAFYDNVHLNSAALDALRKGFATVRTGKKGIDPMPVPPVYHALTLPAGDFVGMINEMREMRRYMKGLFTWSDDMGEVLRMNGRETAGRDPETLAPQVEIGKIQGREVSLTTAKEGMDAIEYQWRVAGEDKWNPLITTGERTFVAEIPIEDGQAAKVELRAHFIQKYKRIGNWSPTYNLAVGG